MKREKASRIYELHDNSKRFDLVSSDYQNDNWLKKG